MNSILKFIICIIFLTSPSLCVATNIQDIYIQKDNKIIRLDVAIAMVHGEIKPTNAPSTYLITISGKHELVDFSTEKRTQAAMGFFYPDYFYIKLSFNNVIPNSEVYLDNIYISDTNKNGGMNTNKSYIVIPGNHEIDLRKTKQAIIRTTINIIYAGLVQCTGKSKIVCVITKSQL